MDTSIVSFPGPENPQLREMDNNWVDAAGRGDSNWRKTGAFCREGVRQSRVLRKR